MAKKTQVCHYCFKTLNPQDSEPTLQSFIQCSECGKFYHTVCQESIESCIACHSIQFQAVEIDPPPIQHKLHRKPIFSIKPSQVIYLDKKYKKIKSDKKSKFGKRRVFIGISLLLVICTMCFYAAFDTSTETSSKATNTTLSTALAITRRPTPTKIISVNPTSTPHPTKTSSPTKSPTSILQQISFCNDIYIARSGDTISKIAQQLLGEAQVFEPIIEATNQAHNIDASFAQINNPNDLEIGDKLCIPVKTQAIVETQIPVLTNTPTNTPKPNTATPTSLPVLACSNSPGGEFAPIWNVYQAQIGCPMDVEPLYGQFAEMPFEHGHLFWMGNIDKYGEIRTAIATFGGQNEGDKGRWLAHQENWNGEGICPVPSPPEGLHLPDRGLAKVWCEIDGINQLGYAMAPKEFAPNRGISAVQNFENAVIFRDSDGNSRGLVYILFRESETYIRVRS